MKVLFVVEDLLLGGAQKHTLELAARLNTTIDCEVLAINSVSPVPMPLEAPLRVRALNRRVFQPRTWRELARAIVESRADVIVTVNQVATLGVAAAAMLGSFKAPRVVIFHSTEVKTAAGWARTAPFYPVARASDAFVYVSENQRRVWTRRGLSARRVETIRNGVHLDRYAPPSDQGRASMRQTLGYAPDDLVIGISAVMRREKNHAQLVRSLADLRSRGVSARLLIIGDGPTRADVEELASTLDLNDAVHITGLQSDVRPLLAVVDVGVICSTSIETLSLSAIETMATGIPMIMSRTGGASEIVTDGQNGYLFTVGDDDALTSCLVACTDRSRREAMGQAALDHAHKNFGYEAMAAAYLKLFTEIGAQ